MKKIYEAPLMNIVRVEQQLLSGASLGKSSTTVSDNSAVLGRRSNDTFWDDEEEE